jgi:two-component system chemotaxis response regulator CheB
MPVAAARAGADLVLPVHQIGPALVDIVAGAPLPQPRPIQNGSTAIPPKPSGQRAGPSPKDIINSAAGRADMARRRAAELRRRREDLSSGFGATAETAATAQRRAGESKRRAQLAHQAAQEAAARWGH